MPDLCELLDGSLAFRVALTWLGVRVLDRLLGGGPPPPDA
jgi:hypothetical protein